jgi:D-tyrosyl-tRNA(Tyr) deacylase
MRVVVQRVTQASVTINQTIFSNIDKGLLLFVGIEDTDSEDDIIWLCNKLTHLRIFNDQSGVMNLSVKDCSGEILVVSQFTLHASTKKGNRPSYIRAAKPEISIPIYEQFIAVLKQVSGLPVKTGEFGADMKVALTNDGPVTILIDSKNKE